MMAVPVVEYLNESEEKYFLSVIEESKNMFSKSFQNKSITSTANTLPEENVRHSNYKRNTYSIFNGKFYSIECEEDDGHVTAKCVMCNKYIKGTRKTTTNFLKHLRCRHHSKYVEYLKCKSSKYHSKEFNSSIPTASPSTASCSKTQTGISTSFAKQKTPSQEEFNRRIIKFLIATTSAVSLLDEPSFRQLFEGMDVKVLSRAEAIQYIENMCIETKTKIKRKLETVKFTCTTADIWSSKTRSFIGVTCHWISNDLKRFSAFLACKRFRGAHTFERIAEILEEIYKEYKLKGDKIVAVVTDNASNFPKALKEYGVKFQADLETDVLDINQSDDFDRERDSGYQNEEFDLTEDNEDDIYSCQTIISNNEDTSDFLLARHVHCVSHTLNLIATTDIMNIINTSFLLKDRHSLIMNRISLLWNKAKNPKSAEVIREILGHNLSYPGVIGWNSYYDSLCEIIKEKDKLKILYKQLELKSQFLGETDIIYLEEYIKILEPFSLAIDLLQSENNTYYGFVIPTIATLRFKLEKLYFYQFKYLKPVLDGCMDAINRRFYEYLTLSETVRDAIVATITHPSFKLRWINLIKDETTFKIEEIKRSIVYEAQILSTRKEIQESKPVTDNVSIHSFFEFFENDGNNENSHGGSSYASHNPTLEGQLMQYLQDPSTYVEMLEKYPEIKNVFMKYNCVLPSSAPVERIFSYATFVNAPKRHVLSDKDFENLILLKAENEYINGNNN